MNIGYCHSGSGILVVEGRVIPFTAGCISVIANRAVRMSRSRLGTPSFWSWFWMDHHRLLASVPDGAELVAKNPFSSPDFPYIFPQRRYRWLCQTVRRMVEELKEGQPGHRAVVKGLAAAFLATLLRSCEGYRPGGKTMEHSGLDRLAPALQYMTNCYAEPISVNDLADRCNLSRTHFHRLFLTAIGKTPLQYLAQLRVGMAATALTDVDKTISQVAFEVGFEAINTFNRQFRQLLGVTPSQWRRQHRQ